MKNCKTEKETVKRRSTDVTELLHVIRM